MMTPTWLKTVPQLTKQVHDAREAYVRWIREQQQAAIDAYLLKQSAPYDLDESKLRNGVIRVSVD